MNTVANFLLCFAFISNTDALYGHAVVRCHIRSEDGHDALYNYQIYYNKQLMASYNSTEGKFRGYTEKVEEIVDGLNRNPHLLANETKNLEKCKEGAPALLAALERAEQKPQVRVFFSKTANSHQPGIIICSAYNFYPKPITLTWLRNGEEVTSDVISTDEMSSGNWLYQKHSHLEYTPAATDTIQCMVEHASLAEPELYKWESSSESRKTKIIVETAGLLLGLVFITVGVIYYKKHTKESFLKPRKSSIIVGTARLLLELAFTKVGVIYYKKQARDPPESILCPADKVQKIEENSLVSFVKSLRHPPSKLTKNIYHPSFD